MPRCKRAAAEAAGDKIKAVLQWETLPESSAQFKKYAAQIDAEFAAEQKSKRVRIEDVNDSDGASGSDDVSCTGETADDIDDVDDIPNADDKAFIEDDDYNSEDTEYVTAAEEIESEESEGSEEIEESEDSGESEDDEDEVDENDENDENDKHDEHDEVDKNDENVTTWPEHMLSLKQTHIC